LSVEIDFQAKPLVPEIFEGVMVGPKMKVGFKAVRVKDGEFFFMKSQAALSARAFDAMYASI